MSVFIVILQDKWFDDNTHNFSVVPKNGVHLQTYKRSLSVSLGNIFSASELSASGNRLGFG